MNEMHRVSQSSISSIQQTDHTSGAQTRTVDQNHNATKAKLQSKIENRALAGGVVTGASAMMGILKMGLLVKFGFGVAALAAIPGPGWIALGVIAAVGLAVIAYSIYQSRKEGIPIKEALKMSVAGLVIGAAAPIIATKLALVAAAGKMAIAAGKGASALGVGKAVTAFASLPIWGKIATMAVAAGVSLGVASCVFEGIGIAIGKVNDKFHFDKKIRNMFGYE